MRLVLLSLFLGLSCAHASIPALAGLIQPAQASALPPGGVYEFSVDAGQTAYGLARNYGLNTEALLSANNQSSSALSTGQTLKITVIGGALKISNVPEPAAANLAPGSRFQVKPGDTLYGLARRAGISAAELARHNNLNVSAPLIAGRWLSIPLQEQVKGPVVQAQSAPVPTPVQPTPVATPMQPTPVPTPLQPAPAQPTPAQPAPARAQRQLGPDEAERQVLLRISGIREVLSQDWALRSLAMLGAPYVFGGQTPEGFDCSGLVTYALGARVPRTSAAQSRSGSAVDELQAGDLLFFATGAPGVVNHVGIYLGDQVFVSANSKSGRVTLDRLDDQYWKPRYLWARRV